MSDAPTLRPDPVTEAEAVLRAWRPAIAWTDDHRVLRDRIAEAIREALTWEIGHQLRAISIRQRKMLFARLTEFCAECGEHEPHQCDGRRPEE